MHNRNKQYHTKMCMERQINENSGTILKKHKDIFITQLAKLLYNSANAHVGFMFTRKPEQIFIAV